MAIEIERKFRLKNDSWRNLAEGTLYRQGYLYTSEHRSVSLQVAAQDRMSQITIQSGEQIEQVAIATPEAADMQAIFGDRLSTAAEHTVRLRTVSGKTVSGKTVSGKTEQGFLTFKTKTVGLARTEFEFDLPIEQAQRLLDQMCDRPLIEKYRYKIPIAGLIWEVEEFLGENQGLILAEVELDTETQTVDLPDWVGEEVSGDYRYFNSFLAKTPFQSW
jgi:adenylate cyclase